MRAGDPTALGQLYDAHIRSLLRYGHRICHDTDLVRDAVQDVFVELWEYRQQLADVQNEKFYLFRMLKSHLSRQLGRRGRSVELFGDEPADEALTVESFMIGQETDEQLRRQLNEALRQLTARQQQAVLMRFYDGFSYDEIADLMAISYQGVVNLIYKATLSLRKHLLMEFQVLIWAGVAMSGWSAWAQPLMLFVYLLLSQ